jgi:hypothetical protein
MARTNRQYASERMIERNPMSNPATREKMSTTLKMIGHQPKVRGGNGTGLTQTQRALLIAMGSEWIPEFVQPTRTAMGENLPTAYKIDLAHPGVRIAVEIDGGSHCTIARQAQDRKKTQCLEQFGWTVLRFTNREIKEQLPAVVEFIGFTILRLQNKTLTSPKAS